MIVNIVIVSLSLLGGDVQDLNNYIEISLWVGSIVGVLSMRKWDDAFAIFALAYTTSTSISNLIYYLAVDPDLWPNAIRVAINIPVIVYLFKTIFGNKYI